MQALYFRSRSDIEPDIRLYATSARRLYISGVGKISSRISDCMLPLLGSPVIQVRQLAGIMHKYMTLRLFMPNNRAEDPDSEFFNACEMLDFKLYV